ncbi:MAG: hypothetical protein NXI16_08490 [Alphaproteobacteria bacterium]|nr:hypothetical protein [Alphaproteobacteria bacterium]
MTEKHDIYYLQVKRLHTWETIRKDKALKPVADSLGRALEDRTGSIRIVAGTRKPDGGYDWATLFFKSIDIPLDALTKIDPPPEAILGQDQIVDPDQHPEQQRETAPDRDLNGGPVGGNGGLADATPTLRADRYDEAEGARPTSPPPPPQLTRERIFEAHPPQPLPYQPKRRKSLLPFLLAIPTAALLILIGGFLYLAQSDAPAPDWLTAVVPPELLTPVREAGRNLLGGDPNLETQETDTVDDPASDPSSDPLALPGASEIVLTAEEVNRLAANVANGTQPLAVLVDRFTRRQLTLTGTLGDVTEAGGRTRVTVGGLFVCDDAGGPPTSGTEVRLTGTFERGFGGRIWLTDCALVPIDNG